MKILDWCKRLLSGKPHFIIGDPAAPYMLRWYLVPRNRWLNVYLHKFLRDDDDRALHDHPWPFASIMLRGRYYETLERCLVGDQFVVSLPIEPCERRTPSIALRRATDRHRVTLAKDASGKPIPCWTLVLTGRKLREWGFWCPRGFVVWHEFVKPKAPGEIGRGCE